MCLRGWLGCVTVDLFAGLPVSDYQRAFTWYERLLGVDTSERLPLTATVGVALGQRCGRVAPQLGNRLDSPIDRHSRAIDGRSDRPMPRVSTVTGVQRCALRLAASLVSEDQPAASAVQTSSLVRPCRASGRPASNVTWNGASNTTRPASWTTSPLPGAVMRNDLPTTVRVPATKSKVSVRRPLARSENPLTLLVSVSTNESWATCLT